MELAWFFWERRKVFYKVTAGFLVLGLLVALLSPVEYEASATLLPESSSPESSASSLLRQYGGFLGIGVGSGGTTGTNLSPDLYPDIVASLPYQVELMNIPVTFSLLDTTITPHEYFRDLHPPSAWTYIKRYTIGLPGQILKWFRNSEDASGPSPVLTQVERDSVLTVAGEQMNTIGQLRDRIVVSQEGGLITVTATFPDPQAAAEIGRAGVVVLKKYVHEYHTRKAMEDLEFTRQQVEEARVRFKEAQRKLAEFRDSNLNLTTAKARTREQELQSQYDLTFNLYNSLVQNLEEAKLRVQEDTPVFTTVEPFTVPRGNSEPNMKMIIIISTFLGIVISIAFTLGNKLFENFSTYKSQKFLRE